MSTTEAPEPAAMPVDVIERRIDGIGARTLPAATYDALRAVSESEGRSSRELFVEGAAPLLKPHAMSTFTEKLNAAIDEHINEIRDQGRAVPVVAGQTLQGVPDIGLLLLTTRDGRPVYVKDVAKVVVGGKPLEQQSWQHAKDKNEELTRVPAVSIAIAKRAGANAVDIASNLVKRLEQLRGTALPEDVDVQVTRNYGATASEKADELLFHLALATVSIVALIVFSIGWREGIVVAIVIPTTILLTLFASWIMG
jgi:multidrug efflux pump subunit AcrB